MLESSDSGEVREVSGDKNQKMKAEAGKLEAVDLRECLGVAVYDKSNQKGYAMHIVTYERDAEEIAYELLAFDAMMTEDGMDHDSSRLIASGVDYTREIPEMGLDNKGDLTDTMLEGGVRRLVERYSENFGEADFYWRQPGHLHSMVTVDVDRGRMEYGPILNIESQ